MGTNFLKQLKSKLLLDNKTTIRVTTFFACFVLSFSVWVLLELGKNYTSQIQVQVNYKNFPKNKVLVSDTVNFINLQVKAKGSNLLKYKLFGFKDILTINLANLRYKNGGNTAFFSTSKNIESFKNQLGNSIDLIRVFPDTIHFLFADVVTQKKPIRFNSKISYLQQYMQSSEIKISPEYINVSGPKEILDTLNYITTAFIELNDVKKTQKLNVKLEKNHKLVSYSQSTISVSIPVDQFTENELLLSIDSLKNLPKHYKVNLYPKKVNLIYTVPLNKYGDLSASDFTLGIDFKKSNNYNTKNLKIDVLKQPDYIKVVRIEPSKVEYIIQK